MFLDAPESRLRIGSEWKDGASDHGHRQRRNCRSRYLSAAPRRPHRDLRPRLDVPSRTPRVRTAHRRRAFMRRCLQPCRSVGGRHRAPPHCGEQVASNAARQRGGCRGSMVRTPQRGGTCRRARLPPCLPGKPLATETPQDRTVPLRPTHDDPAGTHHSGPRPHQETVHGQQSAANLLQVAANRTGKLLARSVDAPHSAAGGGIGRRLRTVD